MATAALLAGAAAAEPLAYVERGRTLFIIDAPSGWTARPGFETDPAAMPEGAVPAPRLLTLMPDAPAGLMWAGFWAPPGLSDIDSPAAARFVRTLADDLLSEVTVARSRPERIGGRPARIYSGAGRSAGADGARRAVLFDLALIALPEGRVAAAALIAEPAARDAHGAALGAMLASLEAGR